MTEDLFEFRKQPRTIQARRLDEPREIETLEGTMHAEAGDWLIKGIEGELYSCKDSAFRETYEPESIDAAREYEREVDR